MIFERSAAGDLLMRKVDEFPLDHFRSMGTGIPELEADPASILNYIRELRGELRSELRGHDEFDHLD